MLCTKNLHTTINKVENFKSYMNKKKVENRRNIWRD